MCANGSPGSTSPPKLKNTGRILSASRLSVTAMSRIGCASCATASHTPMVSNSRRAPAAIAEARGSPEPSRPMKGSATTIANFPPSPWRNAMPSASPANPPPAITTSVRSGVCAIQGSEIGGQQRPPV